MGGGGRGGGGKRGGKKRVQQPQDKFSVAMDSLHVTAVPKSLPCRTTERNLLLNFLTSNIRTGEQSSARANKKKLGKTSRQASGANTKPSVKRKLATLAKKEKRPGKRARRASNNSINRATQAEKNRTRRGNVVRLGSAKWGSPGVCTYWFFIVSCCLYNRVLCVYLLYSFDGARPPPASPTEDCFSSASPDRVLSWLCEVIALVLDLPCSSCPTDEMYVLHQQDPRKSV